MIGMHRCQYSVGENTGSRVKHGGSYSIQSLDLVTQCQDTQTPVLGNVAFRVKHGGNYSIQSWDLVSSSSHTISG